jgi:hypothetical protein
MCVHRSRVSSRVHMGNPTRTCQSRVSLVGVPWVMGSLKRVSSQCADTNDSIHPSLCSFECVLFHSYPVYVHQLRVSSLGSYMCSPFEGVLSDSNNPPRGVDFMPTIASTSGRLHSEFIRILFLQSHRESDLFFAPWEFCQRNQIVDSSTTVVWLFLLYLNLGLEIFSPRLQLYVLILI